MIWTLADAASSIFESALVFYFMSLILNIRKRSVQVAAVAFLSLYIIICNHFSFNENIVLLGCITIAFLTGLFNSESKWYTVLFAAAFYYLILVLIDAVTIVGFSGLLGVPAQTIIDTGSTKLVCILVSKTTLLAVCLLVAKRFSIKNRNVEFAYFIPIVFIILSNILISLTILRNYFESDMEMRHEQLIILLIGYLTVSLILLFVFDRSMRNTEYKYKVVLLNKQLAFQEDSIHELKDNHLEIRKIWHDVSNNLNNIAILTRNGKLKESTELIESYTKTINDIKIKINSGNVFVDALVSKKLRTCKENNIAFRYDILLSEKLLIDDVALTIILENGLNNAIEACLKEPEEEREITLKIKMANGYIFINIQNPTGANPKIVGGRVETTKKDKTRHGLGLQTVRSIAERYDGELKVYCENGIFTFDAALKNMPIKHD